MFNVFVSIKPNIQKLILLIEKVTCQEKQYKIWIFFSFKTKKRWPKAEYLPLHHKFFHKPAMRFRLYRSGIIKYNVFFLYSGPFLNLNNFWYTIPILIKLCAQQSCKCHLSNAHLVLLMRLVVTEICLLLTPSVGKCHEIFGLTNIIKCHTIGYWSIVNDIIYFFMFPDS